MITLTSILEYIIPLLIFAAFVIAGQILKVILDVYVARFAKRTETKLDDILLDALRTPILAIFALAGVEVALLYTTLVPTGIAQWIHPLIFFGIGIIAIFGVTRALSGLTTHYGEKYPGIQPLVPVLRKLIKILVWFVGIMVILAWLGISISPLLVSFGVGGLAIALALRGTLENFFSGLHIMLERSVKHGDYVKLQSGEEGYVQDIGWRTTKIRMLPNNMVVIPNSKLAGTIITNYYSPEQEMSTLIDVGVSYDSDLRKVEEVTVDVAKKVLQEVPGGVEDFEPFIRYHTFDDFSINFTVILRVKEFVDQYAVKSEFVKALHERYEEEDIVIPFPIQTLEWRKRKEAPEEVEG
ncbi:hypothetical protein AKJ48_00635 [candidate division MSBL1 archaeon SCGC-AAA261O19]|uniref:Mechanosensitive ion channel protein MscS n=2 Tax=candidate division MSBL1 TaxID=215777 RepID=A0A133V2F4_9EURY|nr:hypothetical protein AKJ42_00190 [candidate division MSBL1 archaeon SCGC-AAA261C02]KXB04986.1 hypothetical protein AKJ48_00635 [candidate division MSBL1 archaeon SCGC-AAA261O19]